MISGCVEWDVASRPTRGEPQSGDSYVVAANASGVLVAVIDGLERGLEAARATARAVATLETHTGEILMSLTRRCYEVLVRTRGLVMSLTRYVPPEATS